MKPMGLKPECFCFSLRMPLIEQVVRDFAFLNLPIMRTHPYPQI